MIANPHNFAILVSFIKYLVKFQVKGLLQLLLLLSCVADQGSYRVLCIYMFTDYVVKNIVWLILFYLKDRFLKKVQLMVKIKCSTKYQAYQIKY